VTSLHPVYIQGVFVTVCTRLVEPTRLCVLVYTEGCSSFKQRVLRSSLDELIGIIRDQCDSVVEVTMHLIIFVSAFEVS